MAPKKSTAAASKVKPARQILKPKGRGKEAADVEAMIEVEKEVAARAQAPTDIFQTFTIKTGEIKGGLNIIRPLGNDRFEIVNLKDINQNNLGSVETAEFIKNDQGRLAAMQIPQKDWDSAILKCEIAIRVTEADLFRFFKLPLELREKIIKLVVKPALGIRYNREPRPRNPAASLMLTCRQMYEESKKFFWSNNFFVDHMELKHIRKDPASNYFFNNVQKMTYRWNDNIRDPTAFRFINQFPQLAELQVDMPYINISIRDKYGHWHNFNGTYREELSFGKFRLLRGLDALLEIRGLERVTLKVTGTVPDEEKKKTEDSRKALEDHMMRTLTIPKPALHKAKRGAKGKGRAASNDEMSDGNETDESSGAEEEVYIARPTRSRAVKAGAVAANAG